MLRFVRNQHMSKPTTAIVLPCLFIAIILLSCSGKRNNKVIGLLQNSLNSSNNVINNSTQTYLKELEDKKHDFCTKERAEFWFPKAETIVIKCRTLYNFIETEKSKKKFTSKDLTSTTNRMIEFQSEILSINEELSRELFQSPNTNFQFINKFIWATGGDTLQKNSTQKSNISPSSLSALLSMIQNEVKKIENKLIYTCSIKVGCNSDGFYSYVPIIGQNSTILKPGATLEIKAGIGFFTKAGQPAININGQNILIGEEGFSIFKTKTSKNPGKYKVPVRVKFLNLTTGREEVWQKDVQYTVAKECDQ